MRGTKNTEKQPLDELNESRQRVAEFEAIEAEQMQAERALKESEEKFRSIVNASPLGIFLYRFEPDGRLVFQDANPVADDILGVDCQQFIGMTIEEAFPPLAETEIPSMYRRAATEGIPWSTEQVDYEDEQIKGAYEVHAFQSSPGNVVVMFSDITERKQAEETLRESEERYRSLVANIGIGISLISSNMEILALNNQMKKWFPGIDETQRPICFHVYKNPPQDTVCSYCPTILTLKDGQRHEAISETSSDNGIKHYRIVSTPIKDKDGHVISATEMIEDITESARAAKALQESDERFQQVAENAQEWIWEVDAEGLYTYASPIVEKIFDYTPEEIVGKKHFYDLFHPEDREELKKAAFETFAQKQSFREFINRNVRKDGETIWLSTSGMPILDVDGTLLGYRGADTDITERKKAEEALHESEEKYRILVEGQGEGIAIADEEERFTFVNPAMEKIFGLSAKALIGRSLRDFLSPEQFALLKGQTARRRKNIKDSYELEITGPDGEKRNLLVTAAPRIGEHGEYKGAFGIFRDITERKQVEKERERLIQELEDALTKVKTLSGLFPICSSCKKIRDDKGYWNQVETYIREHSEVEFSHGFCPDCMKKLYPEFIKKEDS